MAKKYYAVKKGIDPNNNEEVCDKIVTTWAECQKYTKGVKGAIYKSFPTEEEARVYLSENNNLKKGVHEYPEDVPHIYVDGSYNISNGDYGYGVVIINDGIVEYAHYGNGHNEECNQRQVNGELQGAIEGISYAAEKGYPKVVLFYDYAGVCQHATGSWSRNTELSEWYYNSVAKIKEENNIEIIFVKIDSHTGDLFNDIADELAKLGAGVDDAGVVDKAMACNSIVVNTEENKEILKKIIRKNSNNIKVDGEQSEEIFEVEPEAETEKSEEESPEKIVETLKSLTKRKRTKYIKEMPDETKNLIIEYMVTNKK